MSGGIRTRKDPNLLRMQVRIRNLRTALQIHAEEAVMRHLRRTKGVRAVPLDYGRSVTELLQNLPRETLAKVCAALLYESGYGVIKWRGGAVDAEVDEVHP